jgi:hypothetical protein
MVILCIRASDINFDFLKFLVKQNRFLMTGHLSLIKLTDPIGMDITLSVTKLINESEEKHEGSRVCWRW